MNSPLLDNSRPLRLRQWKIQANNACIMHAYSLAQSNRDLFMLLLLLFCFVLVSAMYQAAELTVSAKLHLSQGLLTKLNSITMDHSCFGASTHLLQYLAIRIDLVLCRNPFVSAAARGNPFGIHAPLRNKIK